MTAPTLTKIRLGTNDDGTDQFHYSHPDPTNAHVVYTGKHSSGVVKTVDGTEYDVSDLWIAVESLQHAIDVGNAVGANFAANGHPAHGDDVPFVHIPLAYPGTATMALASTAAENAALNGLDGTGASNTIPDVSLHSASPSTTGANENANAGSYARQACTWNAASSGSKTNSTALTFSTLGTVANSHFGTWSSATYGAGTYSIGGAFSSSVTAASITVASGAITLGAT